jgi:hypothetical protein
MDHNPKGTAGLSDLNVSVVTRTNPRGVPAKAGTYTHHGAGATCGVPEQLFTFV